MIHFENTASGLSPSFPKTRPFREELTILTVSTDSLSPPIFLLDHSKANIRKKEKERTMQRWLLWDSYDSAHIFEVYNAISSPCIRSQTQSCLRSGGMKELRINKMCVKWEWKSPKLRVQRIFSVLWAFYLQKGTRMPPPFSKLVIEVQHTQK